MWSGVRGVWHMGRRFSTAPHAAASVNVVFGATGGIGEQLCRKLGDRGAQLVIAGRNEDKLAKLQTAFPSALTVRVDATDPVQVDECLTKAAKEFGRVDAVANCVGSVLLKPAHTTSDAEFNGMLTTNLSTAFFILKSSAKVMMRQKPKGGSILLCSSAVAQMGLANHEAIAAAKAGVKGLALSAAATYAPHNIRINCVAPGLTRTALSERITKNEAALQASVAMHALRRIAEPDEVAAAMAFLMDPSNSFITGQVLAVDGGLGSLRS